MPAFRRSILTAALACLFASSGAALGQSAQLGSPDYRATPEHPYGWRGDWTGRFTGATPPTEWSRRAKGLTTELKYQADKPAAAPGAAAKPLEYFTLKDWLVAGPFSVSDPVADFGKDFLGGEATVEPAKDAKAGDSTWKFLRADVDTQSRHECNSGTCGNSNVDFLYAFGKITGSPRPKLEGDFENKLAYAHTYIYSPSDAKVQLQMPFDGNAGRFWLNGKPTDLDPKARGRSFDVTLNKGWNRLLIKISTANAVRPKSGDAEWSSRWLVAAYLTPPGPVSYETTNVAWMTRMTGRSMSQPIIVGDRIYVGSGITDLMCLDKKTGKVLWMHSNTPYDALTPEERTAIPGMKDKLEPLDAKLETLNAELVSAINAGISPQGLSPAQQADLDQKAHAKNLAERAVHDAFAAVDKKRFPPMYQNEVASSNSTPVSDGTHVYWACGGAQYVAFAYYLSCFDLDGHRVWSHLDTTLGGGEHGSHFSPLLLGDKLIYAAKTLIAYDAKTGKELWRNDTAKTSKDWWNWPQQPVAAKIGDTDVILCHKTLYRAADGAPLGPSHLDTMYTADTPIIHDGVMYDSARFRSNDIPMSFVAAKLPASLDAKAQVLWDPLPQDVLTPDRGMTFQISSPLFVDGLVYALDMTGGLSVVDPAAKTCAYRLWLDGYNRYDRVVFGQVASPTLAGRLIYITDDAGFTHIIALGPKFEELHRNVLENIFSAGSGGNPCKQESFYTSPIFEGKFMYLRGEEYLYCIGGK